jgi:PAS domain S-box-containing protein
MPRKNSPPLSAKEELTRLRARVVELEAKHAECVRQCEVLRKSEAHYRTLAARNQLWFQTASDGIHVLDENGNVVEVNDAFCRMLGYTREELLRLNVADWDVQWSPSELSARFDELTGQLEVFETRHRRKDGLVREVEVSGSSVVLDGRTYFYASVRDITDRKRGETAMAALATRYQTLLQAASDGIHVLDEQGNVVEVNDAFCHLLGYTREELLHLNATDWDAHWEPQELLTRLREDLVNRRAVFETQHRRKDGEMRDVEVGATGVVLDGRVYLYASARDITDRKRAEAAMATLVKRYQSLLQAASDGIHVLDEDGNVVEVNDAFCRMSGYTREELSRLKVSEWDLQWSPDELKERHHELVDRHVVFETRHRRKDGEVRDVEIRGTGVTLDDHVYFYAAARDITDRKRAEATISALAARYQTLLQAASDGIHVLDEDGNVVEVNDAFCGLLGYTHAELQHLNVADWEVMWSSEGLPARIQGLIGRRDVFETRHRRKDGEVRDVEISSTGVVLDNRAYLYSSARDITDRKRLEAAEHEQRELAEALRDVASTLNSTLSLTEVFDRLLIQVQRIVPHDAADVMLIEEEPTTHTLIARIVRGRGFEQFAPGFRGVGASFVIATTANLRWMEATGRPRIVPDTHQEVEWVHFPEIDWVRCSMGAPIQSKGHVIGFLTVHSATPDYFTTTQADRLKAFADQAAIAIENAALYEQVDRHAAELEAQVAARTAELDRERQRLQAILDAAGDGIHFMNPQQEIQYANPTIERITGYTFEELRGQRPAQVWRSALTPPDVYQALDASLSGGTGWQGELISRRKDGTVYNASVTITAIRDADDDLQGFVGIHRDITPQKELERLRSQFVNRIGHELRTPLAAILLNLELLERGKPERQAQYRQRLKADAARLQRLIEAFFQMAGLDANTTLPDMQPVNLNLLARQVAEAHANVTLEHGLATDLQLNPAVEVAPALADGEWLRQALKIVLDNALMYTPPPGTITVGTAVRTKNDQRWHTITIQDTGPGLTREEMPHIFERFYRGSAASNYTVTGTGLGLSIAKALMQKMNGQITVESTPGRGAAFTLWLRPAV